MRSGKRNPGTLPNSHTSAAESRLQTHFSLLPLSSNRVVVARVENIVRLFGLLPENEIALEIDSAVGDFGLHRNAAAFPLCSNCRRNELQLDVLLGHLLLIRHASSSPRTTKKFQFCISFYNFSLSL